MKIKCQICGKKIDALFSLPFGIWSNLCQGCFDRQTFLKQNKNSSSKVEQEDNSHSELKFKNIVIRRKKTNGTNNTKRSSTGL